MNKRKKIKIWNRNIPFTLYRHYCLILQIRFDKSGGESERECVCAKAAKFSENFSKRRKIKKTRQRKWAN